MDIKNKKRVLVFSIAYHPFIGGAEVAVQEITKRLKDFHFEIITLRMDRNLPRLEKMENVTVHRIGFVAKSKDSKPKLSIKWSVFASKHLFPFWAAGLAFKLNRQEKFILSWSIMANYAGFAALFFKFLQPKIPFLLTLQEGDSIEYIKKRVGIFMPIFKMIFKKADQVQAISHFLAGFALEMGYSGVPKVVPNGFDIENFTRHFSEAELVEAERILGKKTGDFFIITSSRLVKKNAVDVIIASLVFLPGNYKLFVAGIGEEEKKLKELAERLKVADRVFWGGFIERQKLPALLKASDIFVRPSRSEGLGNSFIEAMAVGIPIIATPVGGIPDFLNDPSKGQGQATGLFCEVDNPEDLAKQVKRLIEDVKLRETVVENARNMVMKNYDWNLISQRMEKEAFNF